MSKNTRKSRLFWGVLLLSVGVLALTGFLCYRKGGFSCPTADYQNIDSNEARLALLTSFGREVEPMPAEIAEVTVPRKFDAVYESYNQLQEPLGLDLSPLRGQTLRRYTYLVTNHEDGGTVYANLLFSFDRFVGGDVCSASPEGFIECLLAQ